MRLVETTHFRRGKLPHWEVSDGRYFVTVRLADSLPRDVLLRLGEVQRTLAAIEANSEPFAAMQRRYFRTMEKYLDAGAGACLLREEAHAANLVAEMDALRDWNVTVPHFTIMPNHWHGLIVPASGCTHSLSEVMKRLKGRTGKCIRAAAGGNGAVWQREWFDHWIRDDVEWDRTVSYIRQNPVKAGLAGSWEAHPWTK